MSFRNLKILPRVIPPLSGEGEPERVREAIGATGRERSWMGEGKRGGYVRRQITPIKILNPPLPKCIKLNNDFWSKTGEQLVIPVQAGEVK
jgi:hypothetical protein